MYSELERLKEHKHPVEKSSSIRLKETQNPEAGFVDNRPGVLGTMGSLPIGIARDVPVESKGSNHTNMPHRLKEGIESLSGFSMDDVRVHYNSPKPARLSAYAYTQGSRIHLAPGGERHLPHEAWHVAQQKQNRVTPDIRVKGGININNDARLEAEADIMGERALHTPLYTTVGPSRLMDHNIGFSPHMPVQGLFSPVSEGDPDYDPEFHNTSFLARVKLMPINQTGTSEIFEAKQIWVKEVKMSNDRPPTQFGSAGQKSHTVAWTLLRAAIKKMNNQPFDKFIAIIGEMVDSCDLPDPVSRNKAHNAAKAVGNRILIDLPGFVSTSKTAAITEWQEQASDLLTRYIHFYQLTGAATYADGRAVGHGESASMETLAGVENFLNHAANPATALSVAQLQNAVDSAVGMFDAKKRLGDETLARVLHHWLSSLHLAFPNLMRNYHAQMVDGFCDRLRLNAADRANLATAYGSDPTLVSGDILAKDLSLTYTSGIEDKFSPVIEEDKQSTFVANVTLRPKAGTGASKGMVITEKRSGANTSGSVTLNYFTFNDLEIERLWVADDRPDTRFGTLQRSHTVAWTLIRRHLINFGGKDLDRLLNFILHEMGVLKNDIDKPEDNPKIRYDAAGRAKQLESDIKNIVTAAAGPELHPIHQWQSAMSELVETYITLYQLSRSATYAKEERPQGHGEAAALKKLEEAEAHLADTTISAANKASFMGTHYEDLAIQAAKLVDAAVANGNLLPENWRTAVEHWFDIIIGRFPLLQSNKNFKDELKTRIIVSEPEESILAGYNPPKNDKEKLLINLYESAKQEIKGFADIFTIDLKTSIRLELENEFVPPDYDEWADLCGKILLPAKYKRAWNANLSSYFSSSRLGTKKHIPTSKASPGGGPSIENVITDAGKYLKAVEADKDNLAHDITDNFEQKAVRISPQTYAFVGSNKSDIEKHIKKGIDEAIKLSILSEFENYKKWAEVLEKLGVGEEVNYANISKNI